LQSPRPSRREVLRATAAAAAGAALSGCARKADTTGPVTLDFYTYSNPEWRELFGKRLIPAFEKTHPGIKVRYNEGFGDNYDSKLLTLIAGKVAPDLFHVTQTNFPSYASKNVVRPLDEFVAGDPSFKVSELVPQLADSMRYRGQLLGLPSDFSTIIIMFNQAMFDRHNLPYPTAGWTWDDFVETSRKLTIDTNGDGRSDIWGTANQPQYNRWPAWVWMNGGDIFNADLTRCTMDSPASIEGFKFYADLSLQRRCAPRPNLLESEYYQSMFAAGQLGMIAESRYIYKRFIKVRKLDFPIEVAPMPKGKELATTFIWGGNCIYRNTRHPRECWEFLKFMTGAEGAMIAREGGNALPAYRPAAELEVRERRDPRIPKNDALFLDAVSYGRVAPFPRQYAEFTSAQSGLNECFIGIKSPEEACRTFAAKVNEFLSAGVF
jgi:multiple sugar transport system substrate-binding protein